MLKRKLIVLALIAAAPACFAQNRAAPGAVTPGSSLGSSGSTLGAPGSTLGSPIGNPADGNGAIPSTGSFSRPGETRLPGSDTTPGLSTLPGVGDSSSSTGSSSAGSSRPAPLGSRPSPCLPGSVTNPC